MTMEIDRLGNNLHPGDEVKITGSQKLSDAQFVALLWVVKHGEGRIVRMPGGFWTIEGMKLTQQGSGARYFWHTGTQTVMAMERLGLVRRADQDYSIEHWRAPRAITAAGTDAIDAAIDSGQRSRIMDDRRRWNLHDDLNVEAEWGKRK